MKPKVQIKFVPGSVVRLSQIGLKHHRDDYKVTWKDRIGVVQKYNGLSIPIRWVGNKYVKYYHKSYLEQA